MQCVLKNRKNEPKNDFPIDIGAIWIIGIFTVPFSTEFQLLSRGTAQILI